MNVAQHFCHLPSVQTCKCCCFFVDIPCSGKDFKVFKNKYKPWITTAILNSNKKKNKLYKKNMQTKSLESKLIYRNYKNKLTTILRLAKIILCLHI